MKHERQHNWNKIVLWKPIEELIWIFYGNKFNDLNVLNTFNENKRILCDLYLLHVLISPLKF